VTGSPPSEVTEPPAKADSEVIDEIEAVVTEGIDFSFWQPESPTTIVRIIILIIDDFMSKFIRI
jgi:hypothetical protein